jgi:hypothetical protein
VRVEPTNELERPGHAGLVVSKIDHALDSPEQVRRERHAAELGEPIGDAARVIGDAERLVQQDDARRVLVVGQSEVGVDLAVVRREADRLRAHGIG